MRIAGFFVAASAILALAGCESLRVPQTVGHAPSRSLPAEVILVSIDGYRADYLERGDSPVLQRLGTDGVRAQWMIPSFPTVTDPNHYTLLTGLYPDHHGVVDNHMADRRIEPERFNMFRASTTEDPRWWSEATPLWVSAQRDGMHTAEMTWPNGDVRIDGMQPYLHSNGATEGAATVAGETSTVIRWLELPPTERPRLIMLHYEPVDHQGHHYGPDSLQVDAALREVDAALGRLVTALKRDGLYPETDLVVVSDHGMQAIAPAHDIFLDDMIDLHAVSTISLGAESGIDPRRSSEGHRAAMALLAPHPHMQCWRKADLPAHLHFGNNPRVPAIECLATPGWVITTHHAEDTRDYVLRGEHGYDNLDPSMRALFVAEGPSFRQNDVVPPFPNVDVYPLLARVLGITPERNDGNLAEVESLLKPAAL
jgi:predicted AlkP superfamily pyrophosphatase or phosphodiesterase